MRIWIFALLLALVGCQTQTKVRETTTNLPRDSQIAITADTVILDARPFFQYSNGHLPQAIPIRWEDFSKPGAINKAHLDSDTLGLARRLAQMGVAPDTHVVVVGNGLQGVGEEGRVAWSLAYLGVKKIDLAKEDSLEGKRFAGEVGVVRNASSWTPQIVSDLLVPKKEFDQIFKASKANSKSSPVKVLDVRSPADYLKKTGVVEAVNIEWKHFFDEKGRVRRDIAKELQAVGITSEHRIFVVSGDGVRSAAVTMALRQLGFAKAGNLIP